METCSFVRSFFKEKREGGNNFLRYAGWLFSSMFLFTRAPLRVELAGSEDYNRASSVLGKDTATLSRGKVLRHTYLAHHT